MEQNSITIHQAFYGEVKRAHSCIKQTLIDSDLTSFLTTFTDRPGALPPGVTLLPYLSGTAFSKYYVFTKTFSDVSATRAGMVFTHVLILNLGDLILVNNIHDILTYFVDSVENKIDIIQELKVNIPNTNNTSLSKHQPKYIQETISAFISGANPVLFSGELSTFSNALQKIWNSPNTTFRKKIKFRTSFTFSDIENVRDLTIVSIQKDFLTKWQGHKIILGENQDDVEINSFSEALFLGHKRDNPFYNFLVDLDVDFSEVQSYGQYEKVFTNYLSTDKIEDANILRQDIRILAKISPSYKDGETIKSKFLDQLSIFIQDKKDTNLKALRNINWTAFKDGEEKVKRIISSYLLSEFENPNQKHVHHLSELINLSISEEEQNWWHKTVIESIINAFKSQSHNLLKNFWQLIDFSEDTLKNLLSILLSIQNCDVILRKSIPEKLKTETCKLLIQYAQQKNWYLLHAEMLRKLFNIETSIEKQLALEEKLPLTNSVGLKYLMEKIPSEDFVKLTLKLCDKKLIELSAEVVEKNTHLLKDIDLSVSCWLDIWSIFVNKTTKVFLGLDQQEKKIVFSVLDLVLQGKTVNEKIIELIANSDFSDISDYKNRSKIWRLLDQPYKEKFLKTTIQSILNSLLNGETDAKSIELDISEIITEDLFMTRFLDKYRNNIDPVITIFSSFKNLKDRFLSDYISYYKGTISEAQAKILGEIVHNNKFSKSARSIYEKIKYNSSFKKAYEMCQELVSLNWFESIWGSGVLTKEKHKSHSIDNMSREQREREHLPTVVILTAIKEEYIAIRQHLKEIVDADRNDTTYEAGLFEFNDREIAKVIIRECGAKNTNAAQETERAIHYFSPRMILFVGIAGSRKPKDFDIGDVIFPEKVYSYEGGKSEKHTFLSRPDNALMSYTLLEKAKKERIKEDWKMLIKGEWGQDVKADIGIIASGEQVVEHYDSEIGKILQNHFNDTSAVEMEGFGFGKAANRQGRETSNILVGVVRGISDIIEQPSNNIDINNDRRPANAKKFASATASAFAFWLILKTYE